MKTPPNCLFFKKGSSSIWIRQDLDKEAEAGLLANPDLLFSSPDCEIVKDQRKIKVGRTPLQIGGKLRGVYLKRYNAFSWRYRFGSLFGPSAALRSMNGASILLQAGFLTGRPVAAIEHRSRGMLTRSFYISEEIEKGRLIDVYWREELAPIAGRLGFRRRRKFLRDLAGLLCSLHRANIYHNDLKDANILVGPAGEGRSEAFYLLDLEGVRQVRHLNRRRRIKNLVQLNRTMGKLLHGSQKLFALKSYLGDSFSDQKEKKNWVRQILAESQRQDRRSLKKNRR